MDRLAGIVVVPAAAAAVPKGGVVELKAAAEVAGSSKRSAASGMPGQLAVSDRMVPAVVDEEVGRPEDLLVVGRERRCLLEFAAACSVDGLQVA